MGESQAKMREFVYSLMDPKPQMSILGLRPGRGGAVFCSIAMYVYVGRSRSKEPGSLPGS